MNPAKHLAMTWLALLAALTAHAAAGDWPMFRGGPSLSGVAVSPLPDGLKLLWTFKTGGPVKSSAAIIGQRVVIGSGDGNIYALDLATGQKQWVFKTGSAVESSPLVLDGKVFAGSTDSFLYALDLATGNLLWKYQTGDKILGSPNWVKSGETTCVLIGSYDFKLHCVNAATGKLVWAYESSNYINGSPAVADGKTAFGGCDAMLHVISLADGKEIKEVDAACLRGWLGRPGR